MLVPKCNPQKSPQSMVSRYEKEGMLLCSALSCLRGFMTSVRTHQSCVQVTELLNSCTFAARMPADEIGLHHPLSAFRGQMGAVYVFDDVLSGGNPPLSLSASALLVQEHAVVPCRPAYRPSHTLLLSLLQSACHMRSRCTG